MRRPGVHYERMRNNPDRHCNDRHHNIATVPTSPPRCDRWGSDTFWQAGHSADRYDLFHGDIPYGSVIRPGDICSEGASIFPHEWLNCYSSCANARELLVPGLSI